MKLLLKGNTIHVFQTNQVPIEKIKLAIINKELLPHDKMEISFDGATFVEFTQGMNIPKKYHNVSSIKLRLKLWKDSKLVRKYEADDIVARHVVLLGDSPENLFPQEMQSMKEDIANNHKAIIALAKAIKDIKETGELW